MRHPRVVVLVAAMPLALAASTLAGSTARASPLTDGRFDLDVDSDVDFAFGPAFDPDALAAPRNPRIIDVERMHALDCRLDRIRGGSCVLRGFEDEDALGLDVGGYIQRRASGFRIELLERVLDEIE